MDEYDDFSGSVDLSADVAGDASAYVSDAIDGVGAASAAVDTASSSIRDALGFAGQAVQTVSGVLGNLGIKFGQVAAPQARPVSIGAGPAPVQVGSTMRSGSPSTIMYILLAVVAVIVLVYALG